jgi:hypothetical protein
MTLAYQVVDIVVGGLLAAVSTVVLGAVIGPSGALALGAFAAAAYYFSRNPWGLPDGDRYNETIDAVYDRYLP